MSRRRRKERIRKTTGIDYEELITDINNTSEETSIYIGCDSQQAGRKFTRFVTVVVLHIDSCHGARCHFEVTREYRQISMREKLLREVQLAVQAGLMIADKIGNRTLEVHLDINPDKKHGSNVVFKEAINYVSGQGLKVMVKPDSYAASAIADYMVRHVA